MPALWSEYAKTDLIPRIHGFEIMMASYSMAHMKLDLLLRDLGHEMQGDERLGVYLTNSLEEAHPDSDTLFSSWLSEEANAANSIKQDTPVMCVIGNPPYAVSSSNKGKWIEALLKDYKKDLNEKSYNSLSDDYVKFLRYSQHYIQKNGQGVVAMITNNSFLDGVVHRQMRKHMLETYDKIYVIDLHGNAKKKEVCPDGSPDQNVFDIMQGVSICFFVKTTDSKKLAEVHHYDVWGKRKDKYLELEENTLQSLQTEKLENKDPYYFFVSKDFAAEEKYKKGFKIDELFLSSGPGVETGFDQFFINFDKEVLLEKIKDISSKETEILDKYKIFNKKSYKVRDKIANEKILEGSVERYVYKAFDTRNIIYQPGLLRRANLRVFKELILPNYLLCLMRASVDTVEFNTVFCSKNILDKNFYGFQSYSFPLYLYQEDEEDLFNNPQSE